MIGLWDCCENDNQAAERDSIHASLRYYDIEASGPPSRPLDFPTPTVFRCEKVDIRARDHRSGTIYELKNVIMRSELDSFGRPAHAAYLVKKKLSKSIYGSVRLCIVLKRCTRDGEDGDNKEQKECREDSASPESNNDDEPNDDENSVEWESTDLQAVIKASSWTKIHALRGRHLEDPIKEVAAMQHVGNYHPHVLGASEVLQDDEFLYTVMHNLPGGDVYGRLLGGNYSQSPGIGIFDSHPNGVGEKQAREWFRQLLLVSITKQICVSLVSLFFSLSFRHFFLGVQFFCIFQGLFHLQKKGVCHRDISLENLMLDELDQVVIMDLGLSLRVPYSDPSNPGRITDVSGGGYRRLINAQGQGGKLLYMCPEILKGDEAFDGFASDLWAAGVILFVMLVGLTPFQMAQPSDKRFHKISKGELKSMMESLEIPLSSDACDLLQGMFWKDPRRRFTLTEVLEHPWVVGTSSQESPPTSPTKKMGSRKSPRLVTGRRKSHSRSQHQKRVHSSSPAKTQPNHETQQRHSYFGGIGRGGASSATMKRHSENSRF